MKGNEISLPEKLVQGDRVYFEVAGMVFRDKGVMGGRAHLEGLCQFGYLPGHSYTGAKFLRQLSRQ